MDTTAHRIIESACRIGCAVLAVFLVTVTLTLTCALIFNF